MSSTTAQEARPKRRSAADRKAKAQARLEGGNSPAIRPGMQGGQYRPLNDDDLTRIHEAALTILEHTGIGDPNYPNYFSPQADAQIRAKFPIRISSDNMRPESRRWST